MENEWLSVSQYLSTLQYDDIAIAQADLGHGLLYIANNCLLCIAYVILQVTVLEMKENR